MSTSLPDTGIAPALSPAPAAALDVVALIRQLQQLQLMAPSELDWDLYCSLIKKLCRTTHAAVLRSTGTGGPMELAGRASDVASWSPLQTLPHGLDLMAKASDNGYAQAPAQSPDGQSWLVLVLALQGLSGWFLVLNIRQQERSQMNDLTLRALLCVNFKPLAMPLSTSAAPKTLTNMLDLAAEIMQQQNFYSACLTLVNGITTQWHLVHASVGWVDQHTIKIAAISHLDRFEQNSRQTQLIEKALMPALIQGHEIRWPQADNPVLDTQGMAAFAQQVGAERVVCLPIQDGQGITHLIVLLAFSAGSPPTPDLNGLQLSLELVQPRLSDLWLRSLGPGRRLLHRLQGISGKLFGPEYGLWKMAGVLIAALLLYAALGTWNYRVDASAQLNTEATRLVSAQFDGRIDQVYVTAGELVKEGALLVSLDTRELKQQESELTAEIRKAETETDKFRADGRLAETEIAQARLEQSLAKLRRIEHYIEQADSKAPFEGVVVEGEKKELLGAPVKKGDKIFRLAKIEGLYMTLMVTERQMRFIRAGASGEVALLSHPDHDIPIRVNAVIPVAQVKGQEGNQFMITAELLQAPQDWWRPGMTGLARIDVGQKNIAWILTHRAIDNIRMILWW